MASTAPKNVVSLENNVIYIEKRGEQTAQSLMEIKSKVDRLSTRLRKQNNDVRLLINGSDEPENMDLVAWKTVFDIWLGANYDKCASFGIPKEMRENRAAAIKQLKLSHKIVDFETKSKACAWLQK